MHPVTSPLTIVWMKVCTARGCYLIARWRRPRWSTSGAIRSLTGDSSSDPSLRRDLAVGPAGADLEQIAGVPGQVAVGGERNRDPQRVRRSGDVGLLDRGQDVRATRRLTRRAD